MTKVTVYTKYGCPQCEMTKNVLNDLDIKFDTINVEDDAEAMEYVKETLKMMQMPVVVVEGEEPFSGFRPDKLHQLKG